MEDGQQQGAEPDRELDEVEAPQRRRWWRARVWMVPIPAVLLSAAAVMVLFRPLERPADDSAGAKGGALALTVFLGADGARAVADGERVPAGAQLRVSVRPDHACRLWVVSAGPSGQVSRVFPPDGDGGASSVEGREVSAGAVLDGKSGPERFFALCAPGALDLSTVRQAVSSAVGSGDQGVRSVRVIPGLPDGTVQESVVVEKG